MRGIRAVASYLKLGAGSLLPHSTLPPGAGRGRMVNRGQTAFFGYRLIHR